ncbi:MAG: 5-oxoprolinase subunit B family protein [Pseudomonadota bacterium]
MIYNAPVFKPGGDRVIMIELGDEMSFDLNFLCHSYAVVISDAQIDGFVELVPELATIMVSYDPDRISYDDMVGELRSAYKEIGSLDSLVLNSRIYYVPILYWDPWSKECIEDYQEKISDKEWDAEMIIRLNGLDDYNHFKRVHMGTEYWVAALGFWPGLCSLLPLDPRCWLMAPKYNPPRIWTPKGAIGIGGALTCIYPDCTPGGYQIFARTPMPTWDLSQTLSAFKESPALFKPGDRVRFVQIDREEYDYIDRKVQEGTYTHPYVDYQQFAISNYHAWVNSLEGFEANAPARRKA